MIFTSRITSLLLLIGLCFHSYAQEMSLGDVNCDGEIGVPDITMLSEAILQQSFYWAGHDLNCDAEISIADITQLVELVVADSIKPHPRLSYTVPVIFINTDGRQPITSKTEYIKASIYIDGNDSYPSLGSLGNQLPIDIRGRGNATWQLFKKKPYRMKMAQSSTPLGMSPNKHFLLLAHADDSDGFLHNMTGFELSRIMGLSFTPQQIPVELVVNNVYHGIYFLCEHIRVGVNRVNIEEQKDNEHNPELVTGGWLLEIDNYSEDGQILLKDANNGIMRVTPHSPEVLSDEQLAYITDFLLKTNEAINTSDKSSTEWERYIDIDSLARFYIINEIMDNVEAFSGSCYMHKQRGSDTKLIFGPVWDFGRTFTRWDNPQQHFITENLPSDCPQHWIKEIVKFPRFQQCVKKNWRNIYPNLISDIDSFINRYIECIREAATADSHRWPMYNPNQTDFRKELFLERIHNKIQFLNNQWGQ